MMGIKMVGKEKDPPVTVMMSRRPMPGREKAFEEYLAGVTGAARLRPGHLGVTIFRPLRPEDKDYHILFKFDRRSNLERWETSEERARWRELARTVSEKPKRQVVTGLEAWFALPSQAINLPPPTYKMAMVVWLAIFLLITVIQLLFGDLLQELPLVLRTFVMTAVTVPLMTFLVMPLLTRVFKNWLYRGNNKSRTL
jgi:antibiotic biosynthesis monooxygenase (ABM) superfamily enzyme